jgi:hypothetical protein
MEALKRDEQALNSSQLETRDSPNTRYRIPNTCNSPNEPNQVQQLRKREQDDLYNTPRPAPNTEHLTPNTQNSPNEPNHVQNRPGIDLEGLDPDILQAVQELLLDPTT